MFKDFIQKKKSDRDEGSSDDNCNDGGIVSRRIVVNIIKHYPIAILNCGNTPLMPEKRIKNKIIK